MLLTLTAYVIATDVDNTTLALAVQDDRVVAIATCTTPAAPSPLPIPYPNIGTVSDSAGHRGIQSDVTGQTALWLPEEHLWSNFVLDEALGTWEDLFGIGTGEWVLRTDVDDCRWAPAPEGFTVQYAESDWDFVTRLEVVTFQMNMAE